MLIEFKPWHLDMMRLAGSVSDILGKYPAPRILENLAAAGLVFTIVGEREGEARILGVAGLAPLEGGVGEVFVIASEDRHQHRVEFAKSVRRILDRAVERFARIEALGENARWFTWLGFSYVGADRWSLAGRKT